jgi:transglutaminase-like putative cysteine protease
MTCPRGKYDLKLVKTALSTSPPASIDWTQDVFGNLIATAGFSGETDALVVDSRMVVEQSAMAWPVFRIAPSAHQYPFDYDAAESLDLGALLLPNPDPASDRVRAWARSFLTDEPADTLTLLKAINEGVHRSIRYRWRDEEGTQSASETLVALSGSCRDLASLFVAAMRHLGIGARIVSGYLFDPAGGEHGATHAWAEVYLPCAGWIAFDPTNAQMGGANLVPVAVGRAIDQIMPISGSYAGAPEDMISMRVEVSVTRDGAPAARESY